MTITTFLLFWILPAGATHHRFKDKALPGGFSEQFKTAIRQPAGVPERLAFLGDQDGIPNLQIDDRIDESHAQSQVIGVSDSMGERWLGGCAVTGAALDVLDFLLIAVNLAVAHDLLASVAIGAVQCVLAAGELGYRLVIIFHTRHGRVSALIKGHLAQVVVPAVVAGIALGVRDGIGKRVNRALRARGRRMTGGAAGESVILCAFAWLGIEVACQAVFTERLQEWVDLGGGVESFKVEDTGLGGQGGIAHGRRTEMGR